jgi:hypothetical protein
VIAPVANESPAPKAEIPANATDANASFFMLSNPHLTLPPAFDAASQYAGSISRAIEQAMCQNDK